MPASVTSGAQLQQQFLQLFVAQVKNQNPLEPIEQQDFLQQLAQFSVVEGVQQLNANVSDLLSSNQLLQAASLVGKQGEYAGDAGTESGLIESVQLDAGRLILQIDGQSVPFSDLIGLSQLPPTAAP